MADTNKATPTGPKMPPAAGSGRQPGLSADAAASRTAQDKVVEALRAKVDLNHQAVVDNINAIAENARTDREKNDARFDKMQQTLDSILSLYQGNNIVKSKTPQEDGASRSNDRTALIEDWSNGVITDVPPPSTLSGGSVGDVLNTAVASGLSRQTAAWKLHDLPTFGGAPEDWPMFHAMFVQSTEAYGYTSMDNIIRLQRCLVGEAKEAVDFLLMDVNAAVEVIESLQFRFGRPELLAQAQLRRVREIQEIPERKAELILPFASKVANMVAFLDRPRTRQYLMNPELLEELVQKLPLSRRHDWGKYAVDIEPCASVQHFSLFLKELARSVCFMTPAATLANATIAQSSAAQANARRLNDNTRNNRLMLNSDINGYRCLMCDRSGHGLADCRKFASQSVADRWNIARSKQLCFTCLHTGHGTADCNNRVQCGINNCSRPHNPLLHQEGFRSALTMATNTTHPEEQQPPAHVFAQTQQTPSGETSRERVNACQSVQARVMFRIVPVKLYGHNRTVQTYALLDEGSSITMIDADIADELGLSGPSSMLHLQWFDNRSASEASRSVALRISGTGSGHQQFDLKNVRTIQQLELPTQSICMADIATIQNNLKDVPVQNYNNAVPKILIGLDHIHLGVPTNQISSNSPGIVATNTRLGWIVCGKVHHPSVQPLQPVLHLQSSTDASLNELHQQVTDFFSLESFGVRQEERVLESRDDKRARLIMNSTTKRIAGRFETGLLWRSDKIKLPDSKAMATSRLLSVERKMSRDPVYALQYSTIISDYLQKGYARRLSTEEEKRSDNRTWYLPHFAVFNPNKPEKMRVVFDAAAEVKGISLNSVLLKGPDLNRPLVAVLHQFRMGSVGVCADIKEMFLQVRIRQSDVDSQRFLWRQGDRTKPIDVYVMESMIFGAACSPCSAQFVKNTNADEHCALQPEAAKIIHDGHYVDDFVVSFNTAEEAARVTAQVVEIHRQAGFELRGFVSNSLPVLQTLGCHSLTDSAINMELDASHAEKILGMYWCTSEDAFCFRLTFNRVDPEVVNGSRRPTKRELLSATMSVYDPFGLLANFTIYAKLLLQNLWRLGIGWDEPITDELDLKWRQWVAKLDCCRQVRVPRWYGDGISTKRVQLHVFADASQSAYAAVAYWRIEVGLSKWRLSFVAGKSRCAPPKMPSVPRLELQAAVLAVRLRDSIRKMHHVIIDSTYFWSDSKTVVQWVRSDMMLFKPFVAHRIAEILETTTVADWHWVPTQHNAADDATRAKYPVRFTADNRWINGPDFLLQAESQWPQEPADMHCEEGTEEVRPRSVHLVCTKSPLPVVRLTRFSDFHRACRSMAVALRFIKWTRSKTRTGGELQPGEIEEAERHLIRAVQQEMFGAEISQLRKGRQIDKDSTIRKLMPHLDKNGLLRITGRIDKALHLPEDARNPVILPKDHHFTMILVAMYHRRLRHQQQATVVSEIRLRYWVPHLRVIVRRVKNNCMLCRLKAARPTEQVMGQLPTDRVTPYVRPFTYTGVDYFGPLFVKIGRRREKRWVALFTCMTIRAVHLELAADLSTDAFILCLRNFMNLRGVPKRIRSDNGTNFVGASRELREAVDLLDHAAIQRELSTNHVEWIFNCPANPQAGGCWERLVQSVKRVLTVTLKEVAPQVETLRSLLLEAANIVNTRPLTHLPVACEEDEPLTPNHFLLGTANSTQTPGADDPRSICLRKQWRVSQALKNRFWKRWILEYLPDLTRRAKGYEEQPSLTVGSLVLICDPLLPRGQWRRGRIQEVNIGRDGRVRTALVHTSEGDLKRPVTKLAVLDVNL